MRNYVFFYMAILKRRVLRMRTRIRRMRWTWRTRWILQIRQTWRIQRIRQIQRIWQIWRIRILISI